MATREKRGVTCHTLIDKQPLWRITYRGEVHTVRGTRNAVAFASNEWIRTSGDKKRYKFPVIEPVKE